VITVEKSNDSISSDELQLAYRELSNKTSGQQFLSLIMMKKNEDT